LSGAIPQERIFAHLGWRKHGGQWVFLHGGGALSAAGPLGGMQVQLPAALQHFRLCPPPDAGGAGARGAGQFAGAVCSAGSD
jgi:hypothetical protein